MQDKLLYGNSWSVHVSVLWKGSHFEDSFSDVYMQSNSWGLGLSVNAKNNEGIRQEVALLEKKNCKFG